MAQFLGDIAFTIEMALLAAGLVAFHFASKEKSLSIRIASVVLIATGILGGLCTGYYWFKYQGDGAFETAYPAMVSMHDGQPMMDRQMQPMMEHRGDDQ